MLRKRELKIMLQISANGLENLVYHRVFHQFSTRSTEANPCQNLVKISCRGKPVQNVPGNCQFFPTNKYPFKVNNRRTRKQPEICSKL